MTENPIRDFDAFEKLQATVGTETAALLLKSFQDEAKTSGDVIESAMAEKDWRTVDVTAHALKSVSATFGALKLSKACLALEVAAKDAADTGEESEAIHAFHENLKNVLAETKTAFES